MASSSVAGLSTPAKSQNKVSDELSVFRSMNSFRGTDARSTASSCVISCLVYGSYAVCWICVSTGFMINSVRNNAMPISTVLGGFCDVPMAVRKKESEMMILVNEVIMISMDGNSAMTVVRKSISSVCTLSPFTLIRLSGMKHSPSYFLSFFLRSTSEIISENFGTAASLLTCFVCLQIRDSSSDNSVSNVI